MGSRLVVKDYRGITQLTLDQEQQLAAALTAQRNRTAAHKLQPNSNVAARLSSGHEIPLVGLGTWKASPGQVHAAVLAAVRCGYRHIDCASIYGNEHEVGNALSQLFSEGSVTRSDMFITTKLWNSDHGDVEGACRRSLVALQLDYLDLYLIHWPVVSGCSAPELQPSSFDTWTGMETLVSKGLVRSIGVSNFSRKKLQALLQQGVQVKPAVLQVEAHPYWPNSDLVQWARGQGIHVTAYSPLGSPDSAALMRRGPDTHKLLEDPAVVEVAKKHNKTAAQVLIRWAIERGCSVLPKSTNAERIAANSSAFDWSLTQEDIQALSSLPYRRRMVDGNMFLDSRGPYVTMQDLWDE